MPTLQRLLRVTAVVALVGGLVATTSVDIAVAGNRRAHERKVAAARRLERTERLYLQQLTPVALGLYADTQGLKLALSQITGEASPGALVGARDAFAYARRTGTIASAFDRLRAATPPAALADDQRQLLGGVDRLRRAVSMLGAHSTEHNVDRLTTELNGVAASDFIGADFDVTRSVGQIYRHGHAKPPYDEAVGGDAAPAPETWITDADHACVDVALQLVPDYLAGSRSTSAARKSLRDWQRALALLQHRITTIAAPTGRGRLPMDLTRRFAALGAAARVFSHELRALEHQDLSGLSAALAEFDSVNAQLRQLAAAMRGYGAAGCANVMDGWAGTPAAKSGPRHGVV